MPNAADFYDSAHPSGGASQDGGLTSASGGNMGYQDYWEKGNVFSDFFGHQDTFAHNEALAAYEREQEAAAAAWKRESDYNAAEAQKSREWEKMMSDTAFQRKVADYAAAGFSPLAALDGTTGAAVGSGASASASARQANASAGNARSNPLGGILGAVIAAVAMIATKGMSAVSKAAASSGKAAADAAKVAQAAQATNAISKTAKGGMMLGGKWRTTEELIRIARTPWVGK